jgi:hypothetical protein
LYAVGGCVTPQLVDSQAVETLPLGGRRRSKAAYASTAATELPL